MSKKPRTFARHLSVQYALDDLAGIPVRSTLRRWINVVLAEVPHDVALTLRFVDAEEGQALNRDFREKDYATNVLTFEYGLDPDSQCLSADIVVCAPVIVREAQEQNKTVREHYAHMIVHGVLHALGYDHIKPKEAKMMEALEVELLARLGYGNPYGD
jgi:probable rRNA maturation factor